ncbi:hypothetical protein GDO81_001695 [Engystomops pustulosus]|uniref:Intracellular hyaluronan-binding protein 4 N-terminal domain-containing protein n=1 Tax=Engystomops pustulosus TaxID=76066 RepID=A0AAV7DF32_ENGPU|nr:hypothetical protein GDO81_001695 [Engystomops pustulosus]
MKPLEGSPVSTTMQEAFGCAVANRFFQLLDDESDPLDFLHQASSEVERKKKKEEEVAKKASNQKSNKKESQKDRKAIIANSTEAPDSKRAPKQSVQKVTQNENSGTEMKVERSERRTAFREFRSNIIEKPMEYSIDNFEKEKHVRNWVANQRGGFRGRGRGGFPRDMENDNLRGKREYERHSGSDRADVEPLPLENMEAIEPVDLMEEEQDARIERRMMKIAIMDYANLSMISHLSWISTLEASPAQDVGEEVAVEGVDVLEETRHFPMKSTMRTSLS